VTLIINLVIVTLVASSWCILVVLMSYVILLVKPVWLSTLLWYVTHARLWWHTKHFAVPPQLLVGHLILLSCLALFITLEGWPFPAFISLASWTPGLWYGNGLCWTITYAMWVPSLQIPMDIQSNLITHKPSVVRTLSSACMHLI